MRSLFTSESVTSGHPDKVCDRISDQILDEILAQDPQARCAVECMVSSGHTWISGEVTTRAKVPYEQVIRQTIRDIGYTDPESGYDDNSQIHLHLVQQSGDIAAGVNHSFEQRSGLSKDEYDLQGAGDQGMMFGFACDETPAYLPAPIYLAHNLARSLEQLRRNHPDLGLLPDGKSQVSVIYEDNIPVGIDTIVLSSQHRAELSLSDLSTCLQESIIKPELEAISWIKQFPQKVLINPAGAFIQGGPAADTGLTGRKIIVDTYGGMARHGGGAFSGKDPSKVDRSGAYATRYVAKHIVAAGWAKRCEVQVAYAIGSAHPVSLRIDTFGTATVAEEKIYQAVQKTFDLRPAAIISQLQLQAPIYVATSSYGHFSNPDFPWEKLDKLEELVNNL